MACLLRPGNCIVAIFDDYIVLPSDSIAVMSFEIMTGVIVVVACFAICIFETDSVDSEGGTHGFNTADNGAEGGTTGGRDLVAGDSREDP